MVNALQTRREDPALTSFFAQSGPPAEWRVADSPMPYQDALEVMEKRAADIAAGHAPELVWLLEHPPLYTSGTSARPEDLIDARFPVFATGRVASVVTNGASMLPTPFMDA